MTHHNLLAIKMDLVIKARGGKVHVTHFHSVLEIKIPMKVLLWEAESQFECFLLPITLVLLHLSPFGTFSVFRTFHAFTTFKSSFLACAPAASIMPTVV